MRIGVLSDTHGFLDGYVFHAFDGVQAILHAGDIGEERILDELEEIAPVHAVSGNTDFGVTKRRPLKWAGEFSGVKICMTHGHLLNASQYNKSAVEFFQDEDPQIIIHGHSHMAKHEKHGDISIVNPGPAGRSRFSDIPSLALIEIRPDRSYEVLFLQIPRRG